MHSCYVSCCDQPVVRKLYSAVVFISYTCYYRGQESVSDSISAIEALASMWLVDCAHIILTTFTMIIMHHDNYAATGDVVKFFILTSSQQSIYDIIQPLAIDKATVNLFPVLFYAWRACALFIIHYVSLRNH